MPFPGARFIYSLLKDARSSLRGINPCALYQSSMARGKGWTVDRWYTPSEAVEKFGDQDYLRRLKEFNEEQDKAWNAWFNDGAPLLVTMGQYDEAKLTIEALVNLINEDLNDQLVSGELIARGFREPFSPGGAYLTISRHEWRVVKFQASDRMEGGGVSYIGLTIGKA